MAGRTARRGRRRAWAYEPVQWSTAPRIRHGRGGERNVVWFVRERHGAAVEVGVSTYTGAAAAPTGTNRSSARRSARYRQTATKSGFTTSAYRFFLPPRGDISVTSGRRYQRLERAIGMIYRPEAERVRQYVRARLPDQFDVVLHVDERRVVLSRVIVSRNQALHRVAPQGTGLSPRA
jgi:erythromycin esterase-like protein